MSERLNLLLEQINQHHRRGECQLLLPCAEEALALAEADNARQIKAQVLFLLGSVQIPTREYFEAEKNLSLAADIFSQLGEKTSSLRCIVRQAKSCTFKKDFPRALHLLNSARKEHVAGQDIMLDAELQAVEGVYAAAEDNDHERAIACYTRACELFLSVGEEELAYAHQKNLAAFYSARQQFQRATELLNESIVRLKELGAERHLLEAQINVALLAARQFDFVTAVKLSHECLETGHRDFEAAFSYRILYNLSLFELALDNHAQAHKHIYRLLNLQELQLTSMHLGAIQLLLTVTETVEEGPYAGEEVLELVERNLNKETPNQAWLHYVLEALRWLSRENLERAKLAWQAAQQVPASADREVFAKIGYDCTAHVLAGRPGKYSPLSAPAAQVAQEWQVTMRQLATKLFAVLEPTNRAVGKD